MRSESNAPPDQQRLGHAAAGVDGGSDQTEHRETGSANVGPDAGYCSEDNLKELNRRHIDGYIATGGQKHGEGAATGARKVKLGTRVHAMWQRFRRGGHRSRYRLRKQTVEPVFGQIKQAREFRQFLLRGIRKVAAEWSLICTAHNLLKLAAARS